ncbi:MAG: hypothetical protein MUF59_03650, partial [Candidatus Krumholzibacteria bacterium]|nr:hypothetical protein [Candidatus Krumholzibacteria bacterium]
MMTVQSARDSIGTAANDSMVVANQVELMAEKKRLGTVLYNLKHSGIGKQFLAGGIFMYPLLLASIIGIVFIIERAITLARARINVRRLMNEILVTMRSEG